MKSGAQPPRFVPTLTQVVSAPGSAVDIGQEQWMQRALHNAEQLLEQRLRVALDQVLAQHMQALQQDLREAAERVVRDLVAQAFKR